ncbi:Methyltransferase domain-containing protein [Streptomyces sp. 3213]|uniref:class I SAM-dependent methyltransferase n=1 Tax=Streptomyces sp. 3213.3 TaxID=1855348 RepID=UPI000899B87A|nr:class I SAM-dependent methyltransferase [Streptomyces sp. 3213.3]SEF00989.1 Methyltransferase domain-containing protein [Streptomyces sp. 3213] [Streptomyces sp. 3213.3]
MTVGVGFSGEVAEFYAKYRRGYPPPVIEALRAAFALTADDIVLDLGCGTGQLSLPLASQVRSVIGMDPEPDMLRLAAETAAGQGVRNVTWVLGADSDVPALGTLVGQGSLAMTVIGQALHWMRHEELFRTLAPLFRTGGGIAVVANGTPLWQQDCAWSHALRACLEDHFGRRLEATCGTAAHDRRRYAEALRTAGFTDVGETVIDYSDELTIDEIIGGVYSAVSEDKLPRHEDRPAFAERIHRSLPPGPYLESVQVSVLMGRGT